MASNCREVAQFACVFARTAREAFVHVNVSQGYRARWDAFAHAACDAAVRRLTKVHKMEVWSVVVREERGSGAHRTVRVTAAVAVATAFRQVARARANRCDSHRRRRRCSWHCCPVRDGVRGQRVGSRRVGRLGLSIHPSTEPSHDNHQRRHSQHPRGAFALPLHTTRHHRH